MLKTKKKEAIKLAAFDSNTETSKNEESHLMVSKQGEKSQCTTERSPCSSKKNVSKERERRDPLKKHVIVARRLEQRKRGKNKKKPKKGLGHGKRLQGKRSCSLKVLAAKRNSESAREGRSKRSLHQKEREKKIWTTREERIVDNSHRMGRGSLYGL